MSPIAPDRLAHAIRTVGDPEFPDALDHWLQGAVGQDNFTVLAYFDGEPPRDIVRRSELTAVHENFEKAYTGGAYLLDPFHELHVNRAPAGVYRLSEIAPDRFRRNRYYLEYYAATTLVDELAFAACPAPGVSLHICLGRDASSGVRFSAREVAEARRLSPVVLALAERHWAGLRAQSAEPAPDIATSLAAALARAHDIHLSPRQAEVALLILRGHSSVSIALRLGISAQTVKVFRKQLYRKCEISSQAELFHLMLPLLGK